MVGRRSSIKVRCVTQKPSLKWRCMTLFYPVTIRRQFGLSRKFIRCIHIAIFNQHAQCIFTTNQTIITEIITRNNSLVKTCSNQLFHILWNNIQCQWKSLSCNLGNRVCSRFTIQILIIDIVAQLLCLGSIFFAITTQHFSKTCHQLMLIIVVTRRHKILRCIGVIVTPIANALHEFIDNTILILTLMLHLQITLSNGINRFDGSYITIIFIQLIGDDEHCCIPYRSWPIAITPTRTWHNARDITIIVLVINKIIYPLLICQQTIEIGQCYIHTDMGIGCPTILLTMRTIGRNTVIIRLI